jgi:hypothetical protein
MEPADPSRRVLQQDTTTSTRTRLEYNGQVSVVFVILANANPSELTERDVQDAQTKALEDTTEFQAFWETHDQTNDKSNNDNDDAADPMLFISQVQLLSRDPVDAES